MKVAEAVSCPKCGARIEAVKENGVAYEGDSKKITLFPCPRCGNFVTGERQFLMSDLKVDGHEVFYRATLSSNFQYRKQSAYMKNAPVFVSTAEKYRRLKERGITRLFRCTNTITCLSGVISIGGWYDMVIQRFVVFPEYLSDPKYHWSCCVPVDLKLDGETDKIAKELPEFQDFFHAQEIADRYKQGYSYPFDCPYCKSSVYTKEPVSTEVPSECRLHRWSITYVTCPECNHSFSDSFLTIAKDVVINGNKIYYLPKDARELDDTGSLMPLHNNGISIVSEEQLRRYRIRFKAYPKKNEIQCHNGNVVTLNGLYHPEKMLFMMTAQEFAFIAWNENIPVKLGFGVGIDLLKLYKGICNSPFCVDILRESQLLNFSDTRGTDYLDGVSKVLPVIKSDTKKCPFCKKRMNPDNYPNRKWVDIDGSGRHKINMEVKYCRKCKLSFFSLDDIKEIRNLTGLGQAKYFWAEQCKDAEELRQLIVQTEEGGKAYLSKRVDWERIAENERKMARKLPFYTDDQETEKPNITKQGKDRVVYLYGISCHCQSCRNTYGFDTICPRKVDIETVLRGTITVPVQFCQGCGRYFMNKEQFKKHSKAYGLLMEVRFEDDVMGTDSYLSAFSPDSVFSRCGYSVRQGESRIKRQTILKFILDTGRAVSYEFVEFASRQSAIRENQKNMEGAVARWHEDMDFVMQYATENLRSDGAARLVQGSRFMTGGINN